MKENNKIIAEELAELLGKSTRIFERQIKKLKNQSKIERLALDEVG